MREIALMDQVMHKVLKLMLKCVKRLSFDRMVGRADAVPNNGWLDAMSSDGRIYYRSD